MKNKLLFYTILTVAAIIALTYFAFDINRFVAIKMQWFLWCIHHYPILFFVLFNDKNVLRKNQKPNFKTYLVSGPLSLFLVLTLFSILYQATSMKRTDEVASFLRMNELRLRQVVENEKGEARANKILTDLNVRLRKGENDSYHFELYGFLGYGYRILYTKELARMAPESPGGSPTLKWHHIKQNWYYYSYVD